MCSYLLIQLFYGYFTLDELRIFLNGRSPYVKCECFLAETQMELESECEFICYSCDLKG